MLGLLIFSWALVSLAAAQPAVETPRTIRVVTDNDFAPYSFQADDGTPHGILIDQWRAWEKKTGIKAEVHAMNWGEALRRMRAGEFDVLDSVVETPERLEYLDFTEPYAHIEASIFFRTDISGIADIASLRGFPVAVKAGDQRIDKLRQGGVTTLIPFRNIREMVEAARQRKINVFMADAPAAHYVLNKTGIQAEFRQSAAIFRDELRRAVRKGDANMLRTVADGFAAVDPDELRQIDEKWFGSPIAGYSRYLVYAAYLAALAMLLVASLAGWNRMLRKGILQRTAALSESEQRFRQIAESIREVFWMTTPSLDQVLYVSPGYVNIWGRSLESLRQEPRSFLDAIHPEDRERAFGILERQREGGFEVEYRVVRPDGSVRWIRDRGFPVKDASGKTYRVVGLAEDITERKKVGEALRQSEFDMAEAQRVARLGNWTFDIAADTVRWSEELYRIFDIEHSAFGGNYEAFLSRVMPEDRRRVQQANATARSSGQPYEVEYDVKIRTGERKHIRELGYAMMDPSGAVTSLFGTAQDVTERKNAENALRASATQLQALSRRLVELQESERRELARELHDRVGQNLTALKINLEILRPSFAAPGNDASRARVDDAAALLESTMDVIDNVMSDLRPPMLDDHGLVAALDWYARNFSARTGIAVAVRDDGPTMRPPAQVGIALFRIAQEALNNVAKHARARRVEIAFDHANGEYAMFVQDDGIGFDGVDDPSIKPNPRLGIVTMRERSQAIGGRFDVRALPGGGTRLAVRVPV
jgi:PAS domain S-box-containing protein